MIAPERAVLNEEAFGIYCRSGEHERCSMVCACPHHDELPVRALSWAGIPQEDRIKLRSVE